jgi:hypothetical protein
MGYYYNTYALIFKNFVEDLYSFRKEMKKSNRKEEVILKKLMNSLYGRLGIKGNPRETVVTNVSDWFDNFSLEEASLFHNVEEHEDFVVIEKDVEYKEVFQKIFKPRVD